MRVEGGGEDVGLGAPTLCCCVAAFRASRTATGIFRAAGEPERGDVQRAFGLSDGICWLQATVSYGVRPQASLSKVCVLL